MPLMIACEARTCGKPLAEQGALIFGPRDERGNRRKINICASCYPNFRTLVADDRMLMGYERRQPSLVAPPDASGMVKEHDFTEKTFIAMSSMFR